MLHADRTALILAHPGHELRLHGWLEIAQPRVSILTDGSGSAGHSRVPSSLDVLRRTGAHASDIAGAFTDHELYRLVMQQDAAPLAAVTLLLARDLVDHDIAMVVADAWEGYNPAHDLCRVIAALAVEHARRLTPRDLQLFDYAVTGRSRIDGASGEIVVTLDDAALARKLAASFAYPELRGDVDDLMREHGVEGMRHEVLRPATEDALTFREKPFYEIRGEQQVAAGRYTSVLRWSEHMRPLVERLRALVASAPARPATLRIAHP